ncbi:SDR family oxidoreductase [Amycolatopsis sp. NPDC098790]|uniref:SDR family oxidoreductase n=1 Tax=Amycolatopsis sp. NPDC098790 TaxID=3363939 RepID=UPI0037FCE614
MKVLVTGATGNTGRHVVTGLLDHGVDVRVLLRDPAKAPGGEIVQGDISDPAEAAEGVDAVYFVWPFYSSEGIDKALKSFENKKIVYVSSAAAEDGGFWGDVEAAVQKVTDDWTFLRITGLATNTLGWVTQAKTGKVRAPYGQAKRSLVHEKDVADMAVEAFTGDHRSQIYLVTGPEALTQARQAEILGAALGTRTRWEEQPEHEAITQLGAEFAAQALPYWASLVTEPEPVSLDVPTVTGHPARSFEDWARERFS